jgi:hypothetical protein
MNSLEQIRSIFDEGTAGLVPIGMPGIEKRIARIPQFYSRTGFVHAFRPLDAEQIQTLLESQQAHATRDVVHQFPYPGGCGPLASDEPPALPSEKQLQ